MGDDDAFGGLVPAAVFVDAGMGLDGADDAVGGGSDGLGLFHDEFEGAAGACGTLAKQVKGVGVTVDDAAVVELEVVGDSGGPFRVEEGFVDGVAIGMAADGAVGLVMARADSASLAGLGLEVRYRRDSDWRCVAGFAAAGSC